MADQWDKMVFDVSAQTLEVAQAAMIQTGQMVISKTPVDTGMAKNSWNTAIGAIDRTEQPVDKSGQDAISRLTAVARSLQLGQEAYFTSSLPYIVPLEYGHSQQAPTGMLRISLARWSLTVAEVTRELKK